MTALDAQPVAIADDAVPAEARGRRKRPRHVKGTRPGWFVYACLGVVLLASVFPFYWSLLIGSGDSYTIRDPNMSWIPGGNFFSNAAKVMNDPAVNFWVALWNSIISSGLIALSVVFFSTLAGWAFAKLRFRGSSWLLVFVIATMAVPTQLGVVPLYILFSDLGWTGQLGAIIVPALVSAFGVFWMTQYLRQAVPDELIEAARVQSNYFVDYSIVLAGVLLATIPLLILFVFAGRQLVSGIMQGAVKG
ncbi:MAG: carbohydrate ABC transporter permease [Microbacterium sp.]